MHVLLCTQMMDLGSVHERTAALFTINLAQYAPAAVHGEEDRIMVRLLGPGMGAGGTAYACLALTSQMYIMDPAPASMPLSSVKMLLCGACQGVTAAVLVHNSQLPLSGTIRGDGLATAVSSSSSSGGSIECFQAIRTTSDVSIRVICQVLGDIAGYAWCCSGTGRSASGILLRLT
jgi:hypothetical protein